MSMTIPYGIACKKTKNKLFVRVNYVVRVMRHLIRKQIRLGVEITLHKGKKLSSMTTILCQIFCPLFYQMSLTLILTDT